MTLNYLEHSVAMDMIEKGYDHLNPADIERYWREKLDLT